MEIITAKYFLPMTNGDNVIEDGAIAVELGKIVAADTIDNLKTKYPDSEVKSYPNSVLMPGLINAHCHLDLVSFFEAGENQNSSIFPKPEDFTENLIASIDYKHDAKPEQVILGAQKGIARLIETGTTCLGDVTHFEGIFELIENSGMRAIIFPEVVAGRAEAAQQRFEIALALAEKYGDSNDDRVQVGIAPYAAYLLSRNLLKIISRHAKDTSIPVVIHAAESFAEMEFFFDSAGPIATEVFPSLGWEEMPPAQCKTPVAYLADIDFFEAPTMVVGGLHLSGNDFPTLARHLVRVVWCPTMNDLMKHGKFPYKKLSEHGIPIGLGTECWHGKMGFNLWEEMRTAMGSGASPAPNAKEVLKLATVGSARALGIDHTSGTLEKGKNADYIIVRAPNESKADDTIYENLVKKTQPQHIESVVVGGNILK